MFSHKLEVVSVEAKVDLEKPALLQKTFHNQCWILSLVILISYRASYDQLSEPESTIDLEEVPCSLVKDVLTRVCISLESGYNSSYFCLRAWSFISFSHMLGSMLNFWILISPRSMLTTSDIVGLSAGDGLVQSRAILIIFSASLLLKFDPSLGSTSSIKLPFFWRTRAWEKDSILIIRNIRVFYSSSFQISYPVKKANGSLTGPIFHDVFSSNNF